LAEALADDKEFSQRFLREAQICALLDHPGIVRAFDTGTDNGRPYIVMELLEGETLRARLRKGPVPEAEALTITRAVLAALGAAHKKGIVHRDIKPGNVFLCRDGGIKVMDFGIARAASDARLTGTGSQLGTPEYMSPEQAEGKPADARSDLYAVGALLYEMLTGEVPFQSESPVAVLHMQVNKEPPALPNRISKRTRGAVMKALAKPPPARFQDADAMVCAITPGAADAGREAARVTPSPERRTTSAPVRAKSRQSLQDATRRTRLV